MIQFKDNNNNLIYPKGVVDVLLDTPLQANNTANTWKEATLLKNYTKYDIVACRVSIDSNGAEGNWVLIFPKVGTSLQEQFSVKIYDVNYYYGGKILLKNSNKINFAIQHQNGWNYNSFYLSKVIGIKIT